MGIFEGFGYGNMRRMILVPHGRCLRAAALIAAVAAAGALSAAEPPAARPSPAGPSSGAEPSSAAQPAQVSCLESGDGYLRAQVGGAVEAHIDWPNAGTRCAGEPKSTPAGVRLSFGRSLGNASDLLFVFGLSGVREGRPAREAGANLTVIAQGRVFGTLGDSRCTVDALTQRRVGRSRLYRIEVRGFCTQPAHAVRGDGLVLVSTFEFAGPVNYETPDDGPAPTPAGAN
jgi:hypothetical protein